MNETTLPPGSPRPEETLSEDDLLLESRDDVESATVSLIDSAGQIVKLYSPELEHAIYDRSPVLDALRAMTVRFRAARLQVLLLDSKKAIQPGHRLIELSRRIGSQFEFRRPRDRRRNFDGTFMLVDASGYLFRPRADRYRGRANLDDPGRNRQLSAWFDEIWEVADPDPETRQLYL